MGISDDIRPKRGHYHRETPIPISSQKEDDDHGFDLDEKEDEEKTETPKDYRSLEEIEDDFFDNRKQIKREEKEKAKKEKRRHKKSRTKISFWLMTLALIAVLLWQNYSEILSAAKKILGKDTQKESTIETKSDEFYTAEPTTTSETTSSSTTSATGSTSGATTTAPAAPETSIDKSSIKIELLNGNGIKNSAANVKTELVTAGFTVARTTNARNFNYASSIIYYKTGKADEAALVKSSITEKQITLEENNTVAGDYDLVIVIGAT